MYHIYKENLDIFITYVKLSSGEAGPGDMD